MKHASLSGNETPSLGILDTAGAQVHRLDSLQTLMLDGEGPIILVARGLPAVVSFGRGLKRRIMEIDMPARRLAGGKVAGRA